MSALDALKAEIVEGVGNAIEARLRSFIERFFRSEAKMVYSESEAADWFGVSKDTLAAWRRRNLIASIQYPKGRLVSDADDGLSDTHFYRIDVMLSFTETYLKDLPANRRFYIKSKVTPFGAEVEDKRLRLA